MWLERGLVLRLVITRLQLEFSALFRDSRAVRFQLIELLLVPITTGKLKPTI